MYKRFKSVFILLLCLVFISALLFTDAKSPPDIDVGKGTSPPITWNAMPVVSDDGIQKTTLLVQTEAAGEEYLQDSIFVGDSRTNGMVNFGFLEQEHVFAVDGMNHVDAQTKECIDVGDGRALTISEALGEEAPKKIFVSFGINGLAWMSEEVFITEYEQLLDQMQAETPESVIIIQSVIPVSRYYEQKDLRVLNEKIDQYNMALLALAQKKGCYFLNTAEVLKDENNCLAAAFDSGDGMHLTEEAYVEIFEYINTHALNENIIE